MFKEFQKVGGFHEKTEKELAKNQWFMINFFN